MCKTIKSNGIFLYHIMGGLCQTCAGFLGCLSIQGKYTKVLNLYVNLTFHFFRIDINLHENIERCILETFNIRNERRIETVFHLFSFLTFKKFVVDFIYNSIVSWIELIKNPFEINNQKSYFCT